MSTKAQARKQPRGFEEILARNLGANLYRYRVMVNPFPSRKALEQATGGEVSEETIRKIEDSRDPSKLPHFPELKNVEYLAMGLRRLGVDVSAIDLFATPSKPTGQPRHLRSIPGTGEALPRRS